MTQENDTITVVVIPEVEKLINEWLDKVIPLSATMVYKEINSEVPF